MIVTSTGASNRIEGNKLTDSEVESLDKSLRSRKFKTWDEREVVGYLEMLVRVAVEVLGFPSPRTANPLSPPNLVGRLTSPKFRPYPSPTVP